MSVACYYEDCVREALEDAKIIATEEQIITVIQWVVGCSENESVGTGRDCIPNPLELQNEELERERQKQIDCHDLELRKIGAEHEEELRQARLTIRNLRDDLREEREG